MKENEYRYLPLMPTDPAIVPERCSYAVAMPKGRWRQCFEKAVTDWHNDRHNLHWCQAHAKYGEAVS